MGEVLSSYKSFFTPAFWSLRHLRILGGTKVPLNTSFVKNFSNRFSVGAASTPVTSGNTVGMSDNSSYQLKLVLRKMYVNKRNAFTYVNVNTGVSLTDFVYFFFYKQSKYWYNYRSTYMVHNFFLLPVFARSSNFLDISLLDRVYLKPNCQYLCANKERFNVYGGGSFNVGRLSAFTEVLPLSGGLRTLGSFKRNFGVPVQPFSLIGCGNNNGVSAETQIRILSFSGVHFWTNPLLPFFQLKTKIVQVDGSGGLCNVGFNRCLFLSDLRYVLKDSVILPIRDNKPRNLTCPKMLSGEYIYYLWWLERATPPQSCIFASKWTSSKFFSLLMTNFYKLTLIGGVEIDAWCSSINTYYLLRFVEISAFVLKFSRKVLGNLIKCRAHRYLQSYSISLDVGLCRGLYYQFFGRISQVLLTFYFKDFGSSTNIFDSWRFKETRRVVLRITSARGNYKVANPETLSMLDIPSNLLLQFFVFFIVSRISSVSFFTVSLPRLTGALLYLRRFLKSFGQYNALLVIFLNPFVTRMAPYFDYPLMPLSLQEGQSSKLIDSKVSLKWAYLLGERSDLSSAAANLNETSYWALDLMQLGGTRSHYEFFSLYSSISLSRLSEVSPIRNWSRGIYSSDVKDSLNLEFFDALSAWVFNKNSFNVASNNLVAPVSFDIGTNFQLALDFQGAWFFNEFDVIEFTNKPSCYGISNKNLLTFRWLSRILFLPLLLRTYGWKKKRQGRAEQFSGVWVADPQRRVWNDLSPEVLAHKVLIFRREPAKAVWQPKCAFNLAASLYWYHNFEFTFFRL